jgi:cobalt-zinc-cadmium efflux system membrane fusion protein
MNTATMTGGEEHGGEVARLSDEELQEFGIELTTAATGKLQIHTDLTGEIGIDPDRLAHIVPRFPGVVKEVRKKIGDKVRKGEVIAIIESNESLALYEVTSLIDGTVIEMHMTRGEVIEDAGHAVVVADLSHVWVNLSVYQKDLPYMREGQPVVITAGPGIPDARGKVSYLTPVVDEHTRTATARVILPNPDGRWKPGLFVNGRLTTGTVEVAVSVPKTAIETMENRPVVFIQTDDGFKPQTVVLGSTNETHVEITGGLQPGQRYVSRNGFTLKAELGKSTLGEGHGH